MLRRLIPGRIEMEKRTIRAMAGIYCAAHHSGPPLCAECESLVAYAQERLTKCPYQDEKPTCFNCPIHCYKPDRRDQVRQVMRFAGPRMLKRHPVLALLHLLQGRVDRIRKPQRPQRPAGGVG
jgi:hypothetical protein